MDNIIVVAVKGVIVCEGKVLILKRSSFDKTGANTWEFAGGKLEFGEDLKCALYREIMEETGMKADSHDLLYASTFKTHPHRQVIILNYLCSVNDCDVTLSCEHSEYQWVGKKELEKYIPNYIWNDLINNNVFEKMNIQD